MNYRLLDAFQELFDGIQYKHRNSSLGDRVAHHLYEDLFKLGKSQLLVDRIKSREAVLNVQNQRRGLKARRGDGSFGELVPGTQPITDEGALRVVRRARDRLQRVETKLNTLLAGAQSTPDSVLGLQQRVVALEDLVRVLLQTRDDHEARLDELEA